MIKNLDVPSVFAERPLTVADLRKLSFADISVWIEQKVREIFKVAEEDEPDDILVNFIVS